MKSWTKMKKAPVGAQAPVNTGPLAQAPQPMIQPQLVAGQQLGGAPTQMSAQPQQHAVTAPRPMQQTSPQMMPQPASVHPQHMPIQQMPNGMPAPTQHAPTQPAPTVQPVDQQQTPSLDVPLVNAPLPEKVSREKGEVGLPAISIHAFCDRPDTAGAVQATTRDWRMKRTNMTVYMGGLPAAVDFYHSENTPNLILIESGMRGDELFSQLERLATVCDEGTKVVVIGAANDIRLYRELMEKGVSDYLVPPFHPLTLIRSLTDIYVDPDKPFVGRVCAFYGSKGGVGSSTIAHNTAWMMSTSLSQETSLVDLDSSWGTTALDFNYDNVQGLEEALAAPDRLDETLLDRIMVRHTDKLSLLPTSASLNNTGMDSAAAYLAVVEAIRKISPMTLLDLPHSWNKWTSDLLVSADDVIITATPDLANLRNAKNIVDFLKSERPNDDGPMIILNKTGVPKTPEIPVKDFAVALGVEPALVLPYEPALYAQASNDGKMLSEMKTDNRAVDGFSHLASRLRSGEHAMLSSKKGLNKAGKKMSLLSKFMKK